MRSPFAEYQMSAGVCWLLSFSKKWFRVVGTEAPVGERVTMGFTLPHGLKDGWGECAWR
ncbi:Uncharacterised protein [Mycobacterium tuberculosis]|nr:Uncharacterised protein [Mycobacterium tuberculosis]